MLSVLWERDAAPPVEVEMLCVYQVKTGEDKATMMLPVRLGLYAALMGTLYPLSLAAAIGRAVYQRTTKGTPDMILPCA